MANEEALVQKLVGQFAFLEGKIRIQRKRRLFAQVPSEQIGAVFDFAVKQAGFCILSSITGLDLGQSLGVIYHLAQVSGEMLNLEVALPKDKPELQTVIGYFPAADKYERELADLLGVQVLGLPPGSRYPLPDDWPTGQYPLRKDWKPESLDQPKASGQKEVK